MSDLTYSQFYTSLYSHVSWEILKNNNIVNYLSKNHENVKQSSNHSANKNSEIFYGY